MTFRTRSLTTAAARLCLLLALWRGQGSAARAEEPPAHSNAAPTLSPMQAFEVQSAALEQTISNELQQVREAQKAKAASATQINLVLVLAAIGLGVLVIHWLAPRIGEALNRRFDPWKPTPPASDPLEEEQAFSKFAEDFTLGSVRRSSASDPAVFVVPPPAGQPPPVRLEDPVESFLRNAPDEIAALRAAFSGISSATEPVARQKILAQLQGQLLAFKAKAHCPPLLCFWQLSGALEGLLAQLAAKPLEATPSALRSIAAALDLLQTLCARSLQPDLVTAPPVRVLAVDDDPICRHALSFSLSKVLGPPDLASDGVAALALAEKVAYDVIFLDVEMPGMDGFELCSRLGATEINRATPVVFVTRHSDFDTRTQSCLRGGRDLLGKPFLTFELAVKALTMVMQRRLQAEDGGPAATAGADLKGAKPQLQPGGNACPTSASCIAPR